MKDVVLTASAEHNNLTWEKLGEGSYNKVSVYHGDDAKLLSDDAHKGPWVYKHPKAHTGFRYSEEDDQEVEIPLVYTNIISKSERAVRVFKEINPDEPAGLYKEGWVCGFFKGKQPNQNEMIQAILAIYKRTRRIVLDAFVNGNMLSDLKKTLCVDVDLALRPGSPASEQFVLICTEEETQEEFEENLAFYARCSDIQENLDEKSIYIDLVEMLSKELFKVGIDTGYKKVVQVLQALLYLERHLKSSDIQDDTITMPVIKILTWCQEHDKWINKTRLDELCLRLNAAEVTEHDLLSYFLEKEESSVTFSL